ncbi:hypothetical protein WCD74_11665 [Actinomycetospora sp. OC33-EN08]|uniref:Uncharacterized protein n=1 Tax=Actinomycetospora aurantiaca TaxID=3129233 RepID=A0ABU8MP42_9PSEU
MKNWRITPNGATQAAVLAGPGAVAWLVPNEEDVRALRAEGQNAFMAWGEFSTRHADRLRGFSGLLLVGVTVDDAGAFEARHRWRVLTDGVLSARQVQFRAPSSDLWEGATVADHFAEGYGLADLRRVSLRAMRSAIEREEDRRRVRSVGDGPFATFPRGRDVQIGSVVAR